MKYGQNPPEKMKAKEYSISKKKSTPVTFSFSKPKKVKSTRSERVAGRAIKKMQNAKTPEKAVKIANKYAKKGY